MNHFVSVIIVHHDRADLTRRLVSLFTRLQSAHAMEIILVDAASDDDFSADTFPPALRFVPLENNRGYGSACNAGAAIARGDILLITNNDIEFSGDVIGPLIDTIDSNPWIGAVGPKIYFPDGRLQLSYADDPSLWSGWIERHRQRQCQAGRGYMYEQRIRKADREQDVDWITGAFFVIRKEAFQAVHGFDERYFLYFEDTDLCRQLRDRGYRIRYQPASSVVHHSGASQHPKSERIARAFSFGQLHYFAKFRSRISFFALKLYLSCKFFRAVLKSPGEVTSMRKFLSSIGRYPYRTGNLNEFWTS